MYLLDSSYNVIKCLAGSNSGNTILIDANPNLALGRYYLIIATHYTDLEGKFLKLLVYGDGAAQFSDTTTGGVASPQKLVSGVITVGAV